MEAVAQYSLFLLVVTVLVKPVGTYLVRVFSGEQTWLDPALRPLERTVYRIAGVDPAAEMSWKRYAQCFVLFGGGGTLLLYLVLRLQPLVHTFDPAYRPGPVAPDLAMNTAVSFATTTTWQPYVGETTLTYFSQVFGLTSQSFLAPSPRPTPPRGRTTPCTTATLRWEAWSPSSTCCSARWSSAGSGPDSTAWY
jgi:K+-transporting ATPase ATPase A chain